MTFSDLNGHLLNTMIFDMKQTCIPYQQPWLNVRYYYGGRNASQNRIGRLMLREDGTLNMGYDLAYTYGQDEGKKFRIANVTDVNYRTETAPGDGEKATNSHAYEYDANGNLIYVNTGRVKKDGGLDGKAHERKLKWDEENRLLASDDDGFVTNYWYDADGERTVKTSGEGEQMYVNSGFAGGRTNTADSDCISC
jgi:YD repeat-containing protein